MANNVYDSVKDYYGKELHSSSDLKTNACITSSAPPPRIRSVLSLIHDEVLSKYYGCGLVMPEVLKGMSVLDLGSGAGRDCYILSALVGQEGRVVGVDMTQELVEVARKHIEYHTKQFNYTKPNIEFKLGYIERLNELGLEDNSFDIIVSNCVINLSPNKEAVLKEAFRVLKPGGELYFSDVYSDRKIPRELVEHPALYGECLSGALYWNDFVQLAKKVGFRDPRLVTDSKITINNKKLEKLISHIKFFSATYRLFKIPELEPSCEDYGQAVIYKGSEELPYEFILDSDHIFPVGKVMTVCNNTFLMLKKTRFVSYFEFIGNTLVHYGIDVGCGTGIPFRSANSSSCSIEKVSGSCCG